MKKKIETFSRVSWFASTWAIAGVLVLAFLLRAVALTAVPSGFFADEVSFLLNARSIIETGRDEDNRLLPLALHSYIDPKPALYTYFQIPFVLLFGPTVFAARLPGVIAGILTIGIVYWIFRRLGQPKLAFWIAVVLSFSPWHIVVSRSTQEVIFSALFGVIAVAFFVEYFKNPKKWWLILIGVNTFLSMYFYHSMKIVLPLLFATWTLFLWRSKKAEFKQTLMIGGTVVAAFLLSLFIQESNSRFAAVGIFHSDQPKIQITEQTYSGTPFAHKYVLRFFYNKPIFYTLAVIKEYLAYFSPAFLFLTGGEPKRYQVPFHGLMYLIEVPLLLLGVFVSIRRKDQLTLFIMALLFIAPIPAALTYLETPSMIRSFALCFALAYFVAVGLDRVLKLPKWWKLLFTLGFVPLFIWQVGYFGMQFAVQQRVYQPWYRNSPYTAIAKKVKEIESKYTKIRVVNDLRPLYAYFALEDMIPIQTLQQNPLVRNNEVSQLGKFEFTRSHCSFGELNAQTLYIAETACRESFSQPGKLVVVQTIEYDDGTDVYELLEYTPE